MALGYFVYSTTQRRLSLGNPLVSLHFIRSPLILETAFETLSVARLRQGKRAVELALEGNGSPVTNPQGAPSQPPKFLIANGNIERRLNELLFLG